MLLEQIVQIAYWLALSTWFGGVLFIAMAAPVIFRTIRDDNPLLPHVLSVNLEDQHATLLAGSVVGNLLRMLMRAQLVCAAIILLALIGQWFLINLRDTGQLITAIVRSSLFLAAVVLAIYHWRIVDARLWRYRQEYLDNADDPERANPAKDQFDRYHKESVTVLSMILFALLGLILFSGNIQLGA
jgi:hypothetical protein